MSSGTKWIILLLVIIILAIVANTASHPTYNTTTQDLPPCSPTQTLTEC